MRLNRLKLISQSLLLGGIVLNCAMSSVNAEVYVWLDKYGGKHYTDRPLPHAHRLELNAGYTFHQVVKVFDGDTVVLENGSKIRLSAINTPEVAKRDKPAEPGGKEARLWLEEKLLGKKIRLESDIQKNDKYGRTLAHLFDVDGQHINLKLVSLGLATVNIYPPNVKYAKDLLAAQNLAERQQTGLWGDHAYASKNYFEVDNDRRGWQRISGEIRKIEVKRKKVYLSFADNFVIKIDKKYLGEFPALERYQGQHVEARGWIKRNRQVYSLQVRHPGNLRVL